jgi:hypothetical protein
MNTQMGAPALLRRIGARAGVGIWHKRGTVLAGLAAVAAITGYLALGPTLPTQAAPGAGGDCADRAIAALANQSTETAQAAYQCMDPTFQQRVPETTFVQQVHAQAVANVNSISRVGDYTSPAGGSIVYYAVNANGQSVGYMVYLGQDGKVLRVE